MKNLTIAAMAAIVLLTASSCDKSNDDNTQVTMLLNQTQISYDSNGVWTDAMAEGTNVVSQGLKFAHSAIPAWGVWNGFVASRSNDVADYSTGNWLDHQYTVMGGGGKSGERTPYLVAYWNSSENAATLAGASCNVTYAESTEFTRVSVLVNNTPYSYYAIKNGTKWSKKFTTGDWYKLNVWGVKASGETTGPVEVYLADFRDATPVLIKDWTYVNLEQLGKVKGIYFTIDSSDKGELGINTPTYFAIDRLVVDTK